MSATPDSLFERFGGREKITAIVSSLYERVLADDELAPFFAKTSIERLQRMQFEFVASALDGPISYTGAELTAAHKGRGIAGKHFAAFCGHFADAAEEHGVASQDVDAALGRLATYKGKVTGEVGVDG